MSASLVGSEMCIRDRSLALCSRPNYCRDFSRIPERSRGIAARFLGDSWEVLGRDSWGYLAGWWRVRVRFLTGSRDPGGILEDTQQE
eukprot:7292108-Alexandrium_andersonii.AAC.1